MIWIYDGVESIVESDWKVDSVSLVDAGRTNISFDYFLSDQVDDDLILVPLVQDKLIVGNNPFLDETRRYPVDFYFKQKLSYNLTLEIGDGYEVESMPETKMIRSPALMTVLNVNQLDPQKVQIALVHWVKSNTIAPEYYPHLREAYKLLSELKNSVIVLRKKT